MTKSGVKEMINQYSYGISKILDMLSDHHQIPYTKINSALISQLSI